MPEQIFLSQAQAPERVQTHVESQGSIAGIQGLTTAMQLTGQVVQAVDKYQTNSAVEDLTEQLNKVDREWQQQVTTQDVARAKASTAIDDALRDAGDDVSRRQAILRATNSFYKSSGVGGGRSSLFDKSPAEKQREVVEKRQAEQYAEDVVEADKLGISVDTYIAERRVTLAKEKTHKALIEGRIKASEDAKVAANNGWSALLSRISSDVLQAGAQGLDPTAGSQWSANIALMYAQNELAIEALQLPTEDRNAMVAANTAQRDALIQLVTTADGVEYLKKTNIMSDEASKMQAFKDAPTVMMMTQKYGRAFQEAYVNAAMNPTAMEIFQKSKLGKELAAYEAGGLKDTVLSRVVSIAEKTQSGEPYSRDDEGFMRITMAATINNPHIPDEDKAKVVQDTQNKLGYEANSLSAFHNPNGRALLRRSPEVRKVYKETRKNGLLDGKSMMRRAGFQKQDWKDVTVTFRHTKKGVMVDVSNKFPAEDRTGPLEGLTESGGYGAPTKAASLIHMEKLIQDAVMNRDMATDGKVLQDWVMDTYGATPNFVHSYQDGTRVEEPSSEAGGELLRPNQDALRNLQGDWDVLMQAVPAKDRASLLDLSKNEAFRARSEDKLKAKGVSNPSKAEIDWQVTQDLKERYDVAVPTQSTSTTYGADARVDATKFREAMAPRQEERFTTSDEEFERELARPDSDKSVPTKKEIQAKLNEVEDKHNLPSGLLEDIAETESSFKEDVITGKEKSSAGATGLMQIMPATAKAWGIDPTDPEQSIEAAGKEVARLVDRWDGSVPLALASYNFGEGNVKKWLNGDKELPEETRKYVQKIEGVDLEAVKKRYNKSKGKRKPTQA